MGVKLVDKRILAVLGTLIFVISFLPAFESMSTPTTSEITAHSVSIPTVAAAYKGYYVGSINSNVYHKSTCRYVKKIKSYNRIYFKTKASAKKHHYWPCKVCRP
jgi:Adenosine deaminase